MNMSRLRAINQAQIKTLLAQGPDSAALFRAQVIEQILADDQCFLKMSFDEIVAVLVALGFTDAAAREQAAKVKPN